MSLCWQQTFSFCLELCWKTFDRKTFNIQGTFYKYQKYQEALYHFIIVNLFVKML